MSQRLAVALRLDGVLHPGDIAVQSFARHVSDRLPADSGRAVLAGMRGFLEDKPELLASAGLAEPDATGLRAAEDGDQAVALLAAAAGLSAPGIERARRLSRCDLAASAWALEPPSGLGELLAAVDGRALVVVLTAETDPAAAAVLDALELTDRVDLLTSVPMASAVPLVLSRIAAPDAPQRLLVIGTRWEGELAVARASGATTAMVDRFRRNRGTPTWRAVDLAGLLDGVRRWSVSTDRGGTR